MAKNMKGMLLATALLGAFGGFGAVVDEVPQYRRPSRPKSKAPEDFRNARKKKNKAARKAHIRNSKGR